jgi:STE24 endopeptidase
MSAVELDGDRQRQAKEYARIRRRLFLVNLLVGAAYVLIWLVTGLSAWWRDQVLSITANPWLAVAIYALGFGAVFMVIDAPLTYYSGYVLPHRYGLSRQTFLEWLWDQIKGIAISGVLGLILLEVIYLLLRESPDWWWLWAFVVVLVFSVLLSNLAPVLLFPLFYKFTPLQDQELKDRLVRLAERAGTYVRGVFTFNMSSKTVEANATLMGLGNTRRIALGDTLLESFSNDEIETILAHELGHHVHGDLGKGILVQSILSLIGFWLASLVMRWGVAAFDLNGLADPAGLPLLVLAMGVYGLVTMPLGNAYSRWRERLADQYALETTQKPQAFASAMTRLANQNLADADPEPWVEVLLHSHPSISRRVAMAESFGSEN